MLELVAKGTIHNKEIYNRKRYQMLTHVDIASFRELIDRWVLEYAGYSRLRAEIRGGELCRRHDSASRHLGRG